MKEVAPRPPPMNWRRAVPPPQGPPGAPPTSPSTVTSTIALYLDTLPYKTNLRPLLQRIRNLDAHLLHHRRGRRGRHGYLAAPARSAQALAGSRAVAGRVAVAVPPVRLGRLRRSRGSSVRRRCGRRRRRRRRRHFGRNGGRRCRRHTIVILSRLLQRDLGVREELARRLQHRGVHRDAGLVLGVRLDERVEDGPLLLEPVLPAWTPIA